jgi:hypothetical protein
MSASTSPTFTPARRSSKIGGERRFADPALAAAHRDDRHRLALGGHGDADAGDAGAGEQARAELFLERFAVVFGEPGDVEHDRERALIVEIAKPRRAAAGQIGGETGKDGDIGHVRGR